MDVTGFGDATVGVEGERPAPVGVGVEARQAVVGEGLLVAVAGFLGDGQREPVVGKRFGGVSGDLAEGVEHFGFQAKVVGVAGDSKGVIELGEGFGVVAEAIVDGAEAVGGVALKVAVAGVSRERAGVQQLGVRVFVAAHPFVHDSQAVQRIAMPSDVVGIPGEGQCPLVREDRFVVTAQAFVDDTEVVGGVTLASTTHKLWLYVDGTRIADGTLDTPCQAGGGVQIGRAKVDGGPAQFWPGRVDDVRIYNTALTADEISALRRSYDPAPNSGQ